MYVHVWTSVLYIYLNICAVIYVDVYFNEIVCKLLSQMTSLLKGDYYSLCVPWHWDYVTQCQDGHQLKKQSLVISSRIFSFEFDPHCHTIPNISYSCLVNCYAEIRLQICMRVSAYVQNKLVWIYTSIATQLMKNRYSKRS